MKLRMIILTALLSVFSLFALLTAGCSVLSLGTEFAYIRGIVTDSQTGQHIQGVYVRARDYYYTEDYDYTDSGGYYVLTLSSGTYDLHYQKSGYHDVVLRNISVISPFTQSRDIEMRRHSNYPTPTPQPSPGLERKIYALQYSNNLFDVFHFDESSGNLYMDSASPFSTGADPQSIVHLEDKNRIVVVNSRDKTLSIHNSQGPFLSTGSLSLSSNQGKPFGAVYHMPSQKVFVSFIEGGSPGIIEAVDVSSPDHPFSLGAIDMPSLGRDPRSIKIHTGSGYLFAASSSENRISSFNIHENLPAGSIDIENPVSLTIDSYNNRLFAAGGQSGKVTPINISSPHNMSIIGSPLQVVLNTGYSLKEAEYSRNKQLLFTLECGGAGSMLKIWNASENTPSSPAVQTLNLSSAAGGQLHYDEGSGFLFLLLYGSHSAGVRVFDCRYYPETGIYELTNSPFFLDMQYLFMGM